MSDFSPPPTFSGAKLPLRPMHVWDIRVHLQVERRIRDLALFDLAIDSKLRGCDVVALRIGDVISAGVPRRRAIVLKQKAGRPVQFEITAQARQSIARWLGRRPGYGGTGSSPAASGLGITYRPANILASSNGGWSLSGWKPQDTGRRAFADQKVSLLYKTTGNLRACQLLLGHAKLESTVR